MLIDPAKSLLLVIDVQERLAPAVEAADAVIQNTGILAAAARRLQVPMFFSEQYPKGLGATVAELANWVREGRVLQKVHFSCTREPGLSEQLRAAARPQVVITGMEAHVCVLQTVFGLREIGLSPLVVADAVASRRALSKEIALTRMSAAGVPIVTTEMVVFEWLQRAGTPEFRELVQLIK